MATRVTTAFTNFLTKTLTITPGFLDRSTNQNPSAKSPENIINLEEVSLHDNEKDCWIIIYDRVYDVTPFLDEHPGGKDLILEYAGREASVAFRGYCHSIDAIKMMEDYMIGELPMNERIFRKPDGYKISDLPP